MAKSPIDTLFLIVFVVLSSLSVSHAWTPAIFIFGDSWMDVGTNSFLPKSQLKANKPHHGIDFFNSTPNGRFSNGLNNADFITKLVFGKFATSPPTFLSLFRPLETFDESLAKAIDFNSTRSYESPVEDFNFDSMGTGEKPGKGLNFASGGSGLVDVDSIAAESVPITKQLDQFMSIYANLSATIGSWKTHLLLAESTFFISGGSEDILLFALKDLKTDPKEFVKILIEDYHNILTVLYNLGARKFGILGIPYIGCIPLMRMLSKKGNCSKIANDLANQFNAELEKLLFRTRIHSKGMIYSFANAYILTYDFIENPNHYNYETVKDACCGKGKFNAQSGCTAKAVLCKKRDKYVFWDLVNPTQRSSKNMIETFAFSGPKFARPINFAKLVSL